MLNASEDQVDVENLKKLLREMEEKTDLTIVFVHWGEEYRTVHTDAQELLAHVLIDSGADAIIGHHPHVVEDVDEYRGKPIFYSLGNFIFDQYWGPEVEEGYAVRVTLKKRSVTYELLPYIMKERSAPEFIDGEEHTTFLKKYMPTGVFFDGSETYSRE
jgi:poly-gamma-glutamate synthesis protein (capsule biosynthesis protein)